MGNSHLGRVKFLSQFLILRFKFFNLLVLIFKHRRGCSLYVLAVNLWFFHSFRFLNPIQKSTLQLTPLQA
jgi:hypothetical protein